MLGGGGLCDTNLINLIFFMTVFSYNVDIGINNIGNLLLNQEIN